MPFKVFLFCCYFGKNFLGNKALAKLTVYLTITTFFLVYQFFFGRAQIIYAATNIICGGQSSGTCPTANTDCTGTCNYPTCSCVVSSSQSISSSFLYIFKSLNISSGVTLTVENATNGGGGGGGSEGNVAIGSPGLSDNGTAGGSGGNGGSPGSSGGTGGNVAGGGGGGGGDASGGTIGGD